MSGSEDDDDVGTGIQPTPEEWMHITKPTEHDVLCGRGGGTNNHPGNVKFRNVINEYKLRYLAASKVEKPKVARDVIDAWRRLDPPGRILARKGDSKKGPGSVKADGNVWYDVGDKKAREKASQCLRERTPDVLPYVREMRRQQDVMTGQGLRLVEQQMRLRNESAAAGTASSPSGMEMSATNLNLNANINANGGMTNGHNIHLQNMIATMNASGMDVSAFNAAMAHGVLSSMPHTISEPDISNAFSVEHFFTHGFHNSQPTYSASDDPLSLQQMSQDPQRWDQASFSGDLRTMPQPNHVFSNISMSTLEQLSLSTDFANISPDLVGSNTSMTMPNFNGATREPELTLEEYMESMQGFNHAGEEQIDLQRTNALLTMQANSWIKSFHSIENSSKNEEMTFDDSNGSFGDELQKELDKSLGKELKQEVGTAGKKGKRHNKLDFHSIDKASSLHKQTSTRTHLSSATQKSAMSHMSTKSAQSAMSGLSMLSGMSETTRGSKMSANRNQASSLSMMSDFTELTDVSETLANLDLHA
jgi:hypothetical protein